MRILYINPYFVPVVDSEAFCSGKVVKGLMERGIDTTVLAFDYKTSNRKYLDHSPVWDSLKAITIRIPSPQVKEPIRSGICAIRYRTVTYARWVDNAVKEAKVLHAQKPFDLVYSRSLPMISHVAGYWVSRYLGLPWLANINDPWDLHLSPDITNMRTSPLQNRVSNYWLRKTLKMTDLMTYPSKRLWKYHERISGIQHKAEVIPHIGHSRSAEPDPGKITILHAGILWRTAISMRSTDGFFRALKRVIDKSEDLRSMLKVVFVGPENDSTSRMAIDYGLSENVVFTGRVDYEESLRYINSADVCLLVEGKHREGIFLPSKFADYIVSNKPVIALSPEDGTISDLTVFNGIFRADPNDEDAIEKILINIITAINNNEPENIKPSQKLVKMFEEGPVIDKLVDCFNRVLAGN